MDINFNKPVLSFPVVFEAKNEYELGDTRFTKVQIRLMHLGENLNASYFDKEVVDNALPSLAYIPIVGFIEDNKKGEEDFSDHRYVLTRTEEGLERKYLGSAYGVILSEEDNNAHYEDIVCDDGETRTFLVVDGICWNMFEDSTNILQDNISRPQSMELQPDSIYGYEDENHVFHFTEFSFRASCILGEGFQPAMMNSKIEVDFTVDGFLDAIQKEIKDKYDSFVNYIEQGGKSEMDYEEKKNLDNTELEEVEEVAETEEVVDDIEVEEATESVEVEDSEEEDSEPVDEGAEETEEVEDAEDADETEEAEVVEAEVVEGENADYALTNGNLVQEIVSILDEVKFTDSEGDVYWKYWFIDLQDNEAIVYDAENNWNLYGIPFTMNGDMPVMDFENAKRKKVVYEDFDMGNADEPEIVNAFDARIKQYVSRSSYDSLKKEYDEVKAQNDQYALNEQERLDAIEDAKKEEELAKYELALADVADFEELKSKKDEYTFEEIESKCAIMFARKNIDVKLNNSNKGTAKARLVFEADEGDKDFVQTKYGKIYKNIHK